jgi:hypothetical protein
MALTADRYTKKKVGDIVEYPVLTNTVIYGGGMVSIDANGYAFPSTDASGQRFVGIAEEAVDNNPGSSGDKTVRVRRDGIHLLDGYNMSQAKVGDIAEVKDDYTVHFAGGGSNTIKVGEIVQYVSSTSVWVDITRNS